MTLDRVLHSLERTREYLGQFFPRTVDEITVVLHPSVADRSRWRGRSCPWRGSPPRPRRGATWPAGADRTSSTCCCPTRSRLARRTFQAHGRCSSRAVPALYARRVILENNRICPASAQPPPGGSGAALGVAAGGLGALVRRPDRARPAGHRAASARGRRPAFPPGLRDAALLGGTVIDLLVARAGRAGRRTARLPAASAGPPRRAARGVRRAHAGGHRGAMARAPGADGVGGVAVRRQTWLSSHTSSAPTTSAISSPTSRRPGETTRVAGSSDISSASSSTSRAAARRRLGHHHVARAGGEEVGDVEAGAPPQHARDPLLEQQALDELSLGLVARAGHAHQRPLGELRLDLARALVALGHLLDLRPVCLYQRQLAVGAEPLVAREYVPARGTTQLVEIEGPPTTPTTRRRHHSTTSSASDTWPSSIRHVRTSTSPLASPTMIHRTPGQSFAKLMSVCDGRGSVRVWEW